MQLFHERVFSRYDQVDGRLLLQDAAAVRDEPPDSTAVSVFQGNDEMNMVRHDDEVGQLDVASGPAYALKHGRHCGSRRMRPPIRAGETVFDGAEERLSVGGA